jgi:elongator complex protein 3
MDVCGEIARKLLEGGVSTRSEVEELKRRICAQAGCERVPTDAEILSRLDGTDRRTLLELLRTKPSRTLSGVAVVAVMTPPARCPHGRCAYCPGGVDFGTPQSYTGDEPAARRARRVDYDPSAQVSARLEQLAAAGHATDKVELVIMGGTFPATDPGFRTSFVKACLDVMNGRPSSDLPTAIRSNEGAPKRCVALTIETRPDLCSRDGVDELLAMGSTRVEIGVQTTDDGVLERVGRGHDTSVTVEATRNLKDAGLKVGYHLMLGLPGLDREQDLAAMRGIFEGADFRPDLLKLYPTLVMEGTPLHDWWRRGAYQPLDEEGAVDLLAGLKVGLPRWVRVSRVERDIPSGLIAAGVRASNLRQLVHRRLAEEGLRCHCVRCREVGRHGTERLSKGWREAQEPDPDAVELREEIYTASQGEEAFISLELPVDDALVGYARVRLPSMEAWRQELEGAAVLRELRVLGEALPLGAIPSRDMGSLQWQHRGLGRRLLDASEARALDWGMSRLAVTSGMGARDYFRPLGYELRGPYMLSRSLNR